MRVLKLLQELYLELKTFNENVEYFTCLKHEKERRRENPMSSMTDIERISFKIWLNKRLQEKNITFEGDSYDQRQARNFLTVDHRFATKSVRNIFSAVLGFDSFNDLLAAYRREAKGCAV